MTHPTPTHPSSPPPPPRVDHAHESAWTGPPGECGCSCTCGTTFDGFDTLAEATALLDGHVAYPHLVLTSATASPPANPPRLGEIIRDAERILAQALGVLGRDYDPASAPVGPVWSGVELRSHVVMLRLATSDVARALKLVRSIADLPLPPVGSAVHVPVAAGYGTGGESPTRSGGPGTTVPGRPGRQS